MSAIEQVTATDVSVPLSTPLKLGSFTVAARDYVLVEVEADDGLVGHAYALSRGAPVSACVTDLLAPVVTGSDSELVEQAWQEMYEATIAAGRTGLVMRALSLVDIALWDLKAQRAGVPLWRLLGGARADVPVVLVAGYVTAETSDEELLDDLTAAAWAGYRVLKLSRSADRDRFRRLLHEADRRLRDDVSLVVDAAWVWRTPREAQREVRDWPERRLAWVEDPFPPEQHDAYARWRDVVSVPLGAGDEVADPELLARYVREDLLDVIRIDPTTIGGITVARSICGRSHRPVSTHTYPEIGVHLAAALGQFRYVETFDDRSGPVNPFEPSRLFVRGGPSYSGGRATPPERPGLGFDFDPEAVREHAKGGAR